ncbi:hypothetical protein [Leptolyngbya sp. KIOST-1]|nr:hypothetical protein [Leptolyngbya sp. KIOST-1]
MPGPLLKLRHIITTLLFVWLEAEKLVIQLSLRRKMPRPSALTTAKGRQ